MENYDKPFETCPAQCNYSALKAEIYFLKKINARLKDEVARFTIKCMENDDAKEKILRLKMMFEEEESMGEGK